MEFEQTIINVRRWEVCYQSGRRAIDSGNFDEAEKHLQMALQEAGKLGQNDPRIANIHNSLGELYFIQKAYDKAIKHYEIVIEVWEKTLGKEYAGLVEVLENYAEILTKLNRADEAENARKRAKSIQENPKFNRWQGEPSS